MEVCAKWAGRLTSLPAHRCPQAPRLTDRNRVPFGVTPSTCWIGPTHGNLTRAWAVCEGDHSDVKGLPSDCSGCPSFSLMGGDLPRRGSSGDSGGGEGGHGFRGWACEPTATALPPFFCPLEVLPSGPQWEPGHGGPPTVSQTPLCLVSSPGVSLVLRGPRDPHSGAPSP